LWNIHTANEICILSGHTDKSVFNDYFRNGRRR
jgi:hypothetical protein